MMLNKNLEIIIFFCRVQPILNSALLLENVLSPEKPFYRSILWVIYIKYFLASGDLNLRYYFSLESINFLLNNFSRYSIASKFCSVIKKTSFCLISCFNHNRIRPGVYVFI